VVVGILTDRTPNSWSEEPGDVREALEKNEVEAKHYALKNTKGAII